MTDDVPPPNRVRPRVVIAVVVAALLLVGVGGLVGVAIWGNDDEPTGEGLEPIVNVDAPAEPAETPAPQDPSAGAVPAPPAAAADGASTGSEPASGGGDDFATGSPASAPANSMDEATPVNSIEMVTDGDDLPTPASGPVELPVLVTTPPPASTVAALPLADLDPGEVAGFESWDVVTRTGDYAQLTDGSHVVEVFLTGPAIDAPTALATFYDEMRPDLQELDESPSTRLAAPSSRFISVAGSEYVAISAGQQSTRTITGAIVAGVDTDGNAAVITSSREGTSSTSELAADSELLLTLLAHTLPTP